MALLNTPQARLFLALALPIGLAYAVVTPPFALDDEADQLASAYALSAAEPAPLDDGEGWYRLVPQDYVRELARYTSLPANEQGRIDHAAWWQSLSGAQASPTLAPLAAQPDARSLLPAVLHLPALWLGRLFGLPALAQLYLARALALAAYALLCAAAVALAGRLSWLFFVLALTPAALAEGASLSSAGCKAALALLFAALFARAAQSDTGPNARERLWLLLAGTALAACSAPLLLLGVGLAALAPAGTSRARRWAPAFVLVFGAGALILGQWALDPRPLVPAPSLTWQRVIWPLTDMGRAWRMLRLTLFRRGDEAWMQAVAIGGALAQQLRLMGALIATLHAQLVISLAWGALHRQLSPERARGVVRFSLLAGVAGSVGLGFALYLSDPNVPAPVLQRFRGEPFFAVLPWLAIALSAHGRPFAARWLMRLPGLRVVLPVLLLNAYCLLSLYGRYHATPLLQFPY